MRQVSPVFLWFCQHVCLVVSWQMYTPRSLLGEASLAVRGSTSFTAERRLVHRVLMISSLLCAAVVHQAITAPPAS